MRVWKAKGKDLWKAIEKKAQGLDVPKKKPIVVSMIGIQRMASFLGVKKCGEGMVNAIKVDRLPQNPDFAEIIIRCKNKYAQDDKGKDIKRVFNEEKDWKKNLKKRAHVVQEVVYWHNNVSIMVTYKEGKAKWLERYLTCKKELYTMRNVLYMDRIAIACSVYRSEHMEHLEKQNDDGDEEESNEENKEQSGNEEESNNTSESDE